MYRLIHCDLVISSEHVRMYLLFSLICSLSLSHHACACAIARCYIWVYIRDRSFS